MAWIHPKVSRRLAVAGVLGLVAAGGVVRAQDHTPDPYKPYNSMYDTFTYPTYPNASTYLPNQDVLEGQIGVRSANRFQDFLDDTGIQGDGLDTVRRRTGPGVPYYSAYRRLDREFNRVYQPNANADRGFYEEQQARHDKYLQYLRERDPQKRAQLYREYTQNNLRTSRNADSRSALSRAGSAAASESPRSSVPEAGTRREGASSGSGALPSPSAGASSRATRSGLFSSPTDRGNSPSEMLRRSDAMSRSRTGPPGLDSGTVRSRPPGVNSGAGRSRAPGLDSGTRRSRPPGLDR